MNTAPKPIIFGSTLTVPTSFTPLQDPTSQASSSSAASTPMASPGVDLETLKQLHALFAQHLIPLTAPLNIPSSQNSSPQSVRSLNLPKLEIKEKPVTPQSEVASPVRPKAKVRPSGRPPKYLAEANVLVDIMDDSPHGYVETTPQIRKLRQNLATQQCRLNRERNVRSIIYQLSTVVDRWQKLRKTDACQKCIDGSFLTMLHDEVEREKKRAERKHRSAVEIATSTATLKNLLR
ncbi:unnamed protein product, partial [Mesorhabditis spiculigera]